MKSAVFTKALLQKCDAVLRERLMSGQTKMRLAQTQEALHGHIVRRAETYCDPEGMTSAAVAAYIILSVCNSALPTAADKTHPSLPVITREDLAALDDEQERLGDRWVTECLARLESEEPLLFKYLTGLTCEMPHSLLARLAFCEVLRLFEIHTSA
jgi:hypothetical protein